MSEVDQQVTRPASVVSDLGFRLVMGAGALLVAMVVSLTQYFGWPGDLHYVSAFAVFVWALIIMGRKAGTP